MILKTKFYCEIPQDTLARYFQALIGKIFKILPLAEDDRKSADVYLQGLHRELSGLKKLFWVINKDPSFVSLLSILTWLTYHITDENCTIEIIKKEVFDSINLCKQIESHVLEDSEEFGGDENV